MKTENHIDQYIEKEGSNELLSDINAKSNSNKVYFFIIAILALLATNVYFFLKFKSSGEKLYTVTLQREGLQTDIDRIEAELDNIQHQAIELTPEFVASENEARRSIEQLRLLLDKGGLTEEDIEHTRRQIVGLRNEVSTFKEDIIALRVRNDLLAQERDQIDEKLTDSRKEIAVLQKKQEVLSDKITRASSIKVSNIHINGIEIRRNGNIDVTTRARKTDKLQINFTIADNPVAELGRRDIYLRVINPNGNLLANAEDIFYVHGEKLQYTVKETINFTNNGEEYQFLWSDNVDFKKGAYTVLLYADNAIMGRSSIVLK